MTACITLPTGMMLIGDVLIAISPSPRKHFIRINISHIDLLRDDYINLTMDMHLDEATDFNSAIEAAGRVKPCN